MNAHFSPDGKSLVFMGISNDSGNWDVFVHEIGSGGEPTNLTKKLGGRNEDPKWHPTDNKIVFKHDKKRLVETDGLGTVFNVRVSGDVEVSMPNYAADGVHLLYSPSGNRKSAIEVANLLSDERNLLYRCGHAYYPVAEDESSFVFAGNFTAGGKHDQIYRGFIDGREAVPLAFNRGDADTSDPFPIGDGWYFVSSTRQPTCGSYDLFLADAKSGEVLSLSEICPMINTNRQELGACFWRDR